MRWCLEEIDTLDLDGPQATAVFQYMADVLYGFIDWITQYVFEAYEEEHRRWIDTPTSGHSTAIHSVLADGPMTPSEFESQTGYRLDQTHLAVIVWSTETNDQNPSRLEQAVRRLARDLAIRSRFITTPIDRNTLWAWLPLGRRETPINSVELAGAVPVEVGIRVALGLPVTGVEGFRRSHEQATAAYTVAGLANSTTQPVVGYGDPGVAVLSLLAPNLAVTRAWAQEVLGPLADDTDQAATLRETLRVHIDNRESHLRTAEVLGLHPNTVKYRIRKLEAVPAIDFDSRNHLNVYLALTIWALIHGGEA